MAEEESGLISEHHSHADLAILVQRVGRELHQIFITTVIDKNKHCEVICICGKKFQGYPLDKCIAKFETHYKKFYR